ncbi:hypothetical protein TNIN_340801 [Trichonephila inaurata madagascariensis]|uniref:Uncharacterized protein n=1 Tax=Trichonephila inaurata madagascariensis TaxID=2747483 RepID=A0A8X6Y2X8_9ARAC|nr:hypothetical protein TNIN_340801 [Trichonephila inaurata madagascariensis]
MNTCAFGLTLHRESKKREFIVKKKLVDHKPLNVFLEIFSKDFGKHIFKESMKFSHKKNIFSLMRTPEDMQTDIGVPTALHVAIQNVVLNAARKDHLDP